MQHRQFGLTGLAVSTIGQGTWYIDHGDRASSVDALRSGIDLGMTHIDTAEMYGDAELVVAEAMAGRRDELFVVSKVLPGNAPPMPARLRPASARCNGSAPTGSIAISCTGAGVIRWKRRLPPSRNCARQARSCPGA